MHTVMCLLVNLVCSVIHMRLKQRKTCVATEDTEGDINYLKDLLSLPEFLLGVGRKNWFLTLFHGLSRLLVTRVKSIHL